MAEAAGLVVTIFAKLALGIGVASALLVTGYVLKHPRWGVQIAQLTPARVGRLSVALMALIGVTILAVGYGFLGIEPRGDAVMHYYPEAKGVLEGGIPYRDVTTSYGFFFPYINAGFVAIYDSPVSIIFATLLFHVIALWVLMHFVVQVWQQQSKIAVGIAAIFIIHSVSIWHISFTGSNQSWVALLYGLALMALYKGRSGFAGAVEFGAFIFIKAIALIGAPSLFGFARNRLAFVAAFGVLAAVYLATCVAFGISPVGGLINEAGNITSSTLPYAATLFGFDLIKWLDVSQLVAFGAMAMVALWLGFRAPAGNVEALAASGTVLLFTFMLLSPKAYTIYLVMMQVPVSIWLGAHIAKNGVSLRLLVYALVMICAAVDISVWFTLMDKGPLSLVFTETDPGRKLAMGLFVLAQAVQLLGYAYLLFAALNDFRAITSQARASAEVPADR